MADYGLKISQPFYDATTAADSNLLFSSSWPTLPIAAEATFTNSAYGGTSNFSDYTLAFTHGLGFTPFVIAWATDATTGKTQRYNDFSINSTKVMLLWGYSGSAITGYSSIHIVCYNINLAVDKDYPYVKPTGVSSYYDASYGIKIVKDGKSIDSTDLRDFILHSRTQSPQILAVKTEASGITSTLGGGTFDILYTPPVATPLWAFGFQTDDQGYYYWAGYYAQSYPRLFVNSSGGTYTYQLNYGPFGATAAKACLIILRDPMFSSNDITVKY